MSLWIKRCSIKLIIFTAWLGGNPPVPWPESPLSFHPLQQHYFSFLCAIWQLWYISMVKTILHQSHFPKHKVLWIKKKLNIWQSSDIKINQCCQLGANKQQILQLHLFTLKTFLALGDSNLKGCIVLPWMFLPSRHRCYCEAPPSLKAVSTHSVTSPSAAAESWEIYTSPH